MEERYFYVAQDGLELTILLPQPLSAWIADVHYHTHCILIVYPTKKFWCWKKKEESFRNTCQLFKLLQFCKWGIFLE